MDAQQKREARLSRRRERERRLRVSESAEQREARSAKRRVRDRARRSAQSTHHSTVREGFAAEKRAIYR